MACTEHIALTHVGDRSADTIDAGGVLPESTGVLDGYSGYTHLSFLGDRELLTDLKPYTARELHRAQPYRAVLCCGWRPIWTS